MNNQKPKFHVTALFNGQASFYECILSCMSGLRDLGFEVTYADNHLESESINIVLGSYRPLSDLASWTAMSSIAQDIIIYNWEQVGVDVPFFTPRYLRQLTHAHVWDYNANNVKRLQEAGVQDIHYVPIAYSPQMSIVNPNVTQDIDVLFYGGMSERRQKVLDAIRAKGLNLVATDTHPWMMGHQRDDYIARAKVVLNVHHFEKTNIFEIARVSYLLSNRKAVVSEIAEGTDIDDDVRQSIASAGIDDLAQLCFELVHDEPRRRALEQKGFSIFSQRNAADVLRVAVDRYLAQREQQQLGNNIHTPTALPTTLQIGAGEQWHYTYCNIDHRADFAPDLTLNIGTPLPFGETLHSWRFGNVALPRNHFHTILAKNVFQRVDDLQIALTNCLELLVDGGIIELTVPLDLSYDAWMHIDDKRAFNTQTWQHIINDWWHYGWQTHRLEIINTGLGLHNEYGMQLLAENGNNWEEALRTPRAIDFMNVTLRKRALNGDEIKQLPQARFMD